MKKNRIIIGIAAGVVIGLVAFYGGMQYEKSVAAKSVSSETRNFAGGTRQRGQSVGSSQGAQRGGSADGSFRRNGWGVIGEILSKDDKSFTMKTPDGGSTLVYFSDTTGIRKTEAGSLSDVEIGQRVMVSGESNSDGILSAETIQIMASQPAL